MGKAEELVGRVLHDRELIDEGDEQAQIAHEVRDKFDSEHHHDA